MSVLLAAADAVLRLLGAGTTTRSMAADFGPPPAVRWPVLATYSDEYLTLAERDEVIARAQADVAARARQKAGTR